MKENVSVCWCFSHLRVWKSGSWLSITLGLRDRAWCPWGCAVSWQKWSPCPWPVGEGQQACGCSFFTPPPSSSETPGNSSPLPVLQLKGSRGTSQRGALQSIGETWRPSLILCQHTAFGLFLLIQAQAWGSKVLGCFYLARDSFTLLN